MKETSIGKAVLDLLGKEPNLLAMEVWEVFGLLEKNIIQRGKSDRKSCRLDWNGDLSAGSRIWC